MSSSLGHQQNWRNYFNNRKYTMSKLSTFNPTPLYDTVVPSKNKKVKFRPFFVKEERALLAAQESEDVAIMLNTISAVVRGCINTPIDFDLTTFDVEYMFVQIRSKSVGENSTLIFPCGKCGEKTPITMDLRKVVVEMPSTNQTLLKLSDTIAIQMRYPTIEELTEIDSEHDALLAKQLAITSCIESIYKGDEVVHRGEVPVGDIINFVDELTGKQYKMLEEFFDNIPETKCDIDWKCPHCGNEHKQTLKGINSFF
jgi:predicted RNA-binding Zn-ribbon protein involved in translation (DUF1610 family)